MKLSEIVETSSRLSRTRSRLEKMALLGEVLGRAPLQEVPLVVSCLSGRLPRGRLGIGYATLQDMRRIEGASEPSLELRDVDAIFGELERVGGGGASAARLEILRGLYRRATEEEQDFLTRLLLEDLRQGSLEGVMLEAIAKAAATPAEGVRRGFMTSGDFGLVRPKSDLPAWRTALPLTSVLFDCLFLDGVDLTSRPASERFEILRRTLGEDFVVPRLVTSDVEEGRSFVQKALDAGPEGIMAKSLDAPYEAGSRGRAWLKLKTAETLDLVVLAAEWGSGRRRGWLSNLHLGARDPSTGDFVMLGKTFKGLTDEILAWQTKRLQEIATERGDWVVRGRPQLVGGMAFKRNPTTP